MSLMGEALYQGKRCPSPGLTKIRLIVQSLDGTAGSLHLFGYTGAKISLVTANNTVVIDLPTVFNNLYDNPLDLNARPGAATLLYTLGSLLIFPPNQPTNLGRVVWFSMPGSPLPALANQHSRVWFTCVTDLGVTFLPNGGYISLELGIINTSLKNP